MEILQEFSIPLIAGVLGAVLWVNVHPDSYHSFLHWSPFGVGHHANFIFLTNDIFMALFFGIAAKEITESVLPGGALNPVSKAINPLMATLGGVVTPVAVFLLYVRITGAEGIANGWGIPTATDIALAWLVARTVFGRGHPAVSFLLLLAIADDAIGLGIIAVFYPDPAHPVEPVYLLVSLVAMAVALGMRWLGVRSFWPYLTGPGVLSWAGLSMSHLHPALALVTVVPFMPHMGYDEGLFAEEGDGHRHFHSDTLNAFEHFFRRPVDLGLLGFGLANAGVVFSSVGHATWAILLALLVGKTVGVFCFSWMGVTLGFGLPDGMNYRTLLLTGVIASLGLTVALFVAGVAFSEAALVSSARMGALMSALAAPLAVVLGRTLLAKEAGRPASLPSRTSPTPASLKVP